MVKKMYEFYDKVARSKPIVEASPFLWHNLARNGLEQIIDTEPEARVKAMAVATLTKLVVGPLYEWGRERFMPFFVKNQLNKGNITKYEIDESKKDADKRYGIIFALGEATLNSGAYYYIYGESSILKSIAVGSAGAGLMALGNLNGKLIDSALELNDLPNKGRGWIPKDMPKKEKRKIRDTFYGIFYGYPLAYVVGMKIAEILNN